MSWRNKSNQENPAFVLMEFGIPTPIEAQLTYEEISAANKAARDPAFQEAIRQSLDEEDRLMRIRVAAESVGRRATQWESSGYSNE